MTYAYTQMQMKKAESRRIEKAKKLEEIKNELTQLETQLKILPRSEIGKRLGTQQKIKELKKLIAAGGNQLNLGMQATIIH